MNRIVVLKTSDDLSTIYETFLAKLQQSGFSGEIETRQDTRLVHSTDNSIYQRQPRAVVFPKNQNDLVSLARLAGETRFNTIVLAPRGGGTGTNGQSLSCGVVVDLSRHMNRILEINPTEKWARVEPGVVKDQLNAALAPHGLFFAPELSTSNRATIGGMISTDASGQGSCTYGKTRDHVLDVTTVLLGGTILRTGPIEEETLHQLRARKDQTGAIYNCVADIETRERERINTTFPPLNRCLTGYDLRHLRNAAGTFDLTGLICGSEGTLGFLTSARLNLLDIPKHSVLINIRYTSFMDALRDARALTGHSPLSIETIDSKVLGLAMQDYVWTSVAQYFPDQGDRTVKGINLVEFAGHDEQDVMQHVTHFLSHLENDRSVVRLGHTLACGSQQVADVYAMRKRAVGLLGAVEGEARPQPFVEDTAVPPEVLAEYIAEFRDLLDRYGLDYGMFGHVDAGVLHVRPLLDMRDPKQAALIRPISDAVYALTRRYGGLLWGEHGKGVRSEYVPDLFGPLYASLQAIKAAFDPYDQLNPGKIASPVTSETGLLRLDEVGLRGTQDRTIDKQVWQDFGTAMHCNGNGACFNYDHDDLMCPSWKASRDRRHSPKGRATLLKEWLRLQTLAGVDLTALESTNPSFSMRLRALFHQRHAATHDFSHQLYDSLAACLACKSCTSQCPVKVDVPEFRSRFLNLYHQRYARPARDYVVGFIEYALPFLSRIAPLYNLATRMRPVRALTKRLLGLEDMPGLKTTSLAEFCRQHDIQPATPERLAVLSDAERARAVILLPDLFTRYFEPDLVVAFLELAQLCGQTAYLADSRACGKPLHVHGFLRLFYNQARRNATWLHMMGASDVPIVGIDPAMTLVYRQEYRKIEGLPTLPDVLLPQEWLLRVLPELPTGSAGPNYTFLGHCTEKTALTSSGADWETIFGRLKMTLTLKKAGCCGMSGTYGHESRNLQTSRTIFNQSWGPILDRTPASHVLASGYSCRSQVARLHMQAIHHPIVALRDRLRHLKTDV